MAVLSSLPMTLGVCSSVLNQGQLLEDLLHVTASFQESLLELLVLRAQVPFLRSQALDLFNQLLLIFLFNLDRSERLDLGLVVLLQNLDLFEESFSLLLPARFREGHLLVAVFESSDSVLQCYSLGLGCINGIGRRKLDPLFLAFLAVPGEIPLPLVSRPWLVSDGWMLFFSWLSVDSRLLFIGQVRLNYWFMGDLPSRLLGEKCLWPIVLDRIQLVMLDEKLRKLLQTHTGIVSTAAVDGAEKVSKVVKDRILKNSLKFL